MKRLILGLMAFSAVFAYCGEPAPLIAPATFFSTEHNTELYRLQGVVTDAFPDEIDPRFLFLVLNCEDQLIPVSVKIDAENPQELLSLTGKRIEVTGMVRTTSSIVSRAHLGKMICVNTSENIRLLGNDPDPFAAPEINLAADYSPPELQKMGLRRMSGHVRAVWNENEILLETSTGRYSRVSLPAGTRPPSFGDQIEAAGIITTDTYNLNLVRASWRRLGHSDRRPRETTTLRTNVLMSGNPGGVIYQTRFFGKQIRISGTVRRVSTSERGKFILEDDNRFVTVDASSLPGEMSDVARGCKVTVTGTCVFDVDNWREDNVFPRIRDVLIVPNLPGDIVITASAPWFTPTLARTTTIIVIVFLIAFAIWNRILWLRAFHRGKRLSDETIARAEADMRTRERTRLAVELHDSLVQSLSGVIMELTTAQRMTKNLDDQGAKHIQRAEKMLSSCHTDLRNCLWDLRNEALEEPDMESAIRRTLLPHIKNITLDIRFNVSRDRISDNTAHIILRALRELVLNAVRHGRATHIRIAGAIENGMLLISVRDNGCGFDAKTAPGILEGHFGLEGIRERLNNLSGRFTLTSKPGGGVRAVLTIPVLSESQES